MPASLTHILGPVKSVSLTGPAYHLSSSRGSPAPTPPHTPGPQSFVHLPNLEAGLKRLHCHPHLYLGQFARSGYDPVRLTKCGFSWTGSGNYRRYGCKAKGSEPPSLFALGAVQVLAAAARAPAVHSSAHAVHARSAHAVHTMPCGRAG